MKTENILLTVAIIAVIISIIGAGITYNYLTAFRSKLTGFATEAGMVNLTVESNVAINFTTEMVNWSTGSVNDGETDAILDTTNATGVHRGSWTAQTHGLVIENIGNANVSIDLKASNDNATFIGGTAGGGPLYNWMIVNNDTALSCIFSDDGEANNTWREVNTTSDGSRICDKFYFESNRDQIEIDFFVRIPSDSITGDRGSTITATFSAA